jgi:tetratricopeptide (TPR) repeat protein
LLAEANRLREASKVAQALELYGRVVSQEPENVEALTGRGLCYLDLDQLAPAEASLQEALRRSPAQPDALLGLAETYRTQGRKAEAIAQFERYLAAHPGGDEAAAARNAINQLKE